MKKALFGLVLTFSSFAMVFPAGIAESFGNSVIGNMGAGVLIIPLIIAILLFVAIVIIYIKKDNDTRSYFFLYFSSKLFKAFYDFTLWAVVVGFTIGGIISGVIIGKIIMPDRIGLFVCGSAFIGFTLGLMVVIVIGGYTTTFLEIHQKLKNIETLLKDRNNNIEESEK